MMALALKILLAYLLGSASGSLLLGKIRRVDIRTMGSGNAGGTNAFRTQGLVFALGVAIVDIGKGVLAAGWIPGSALFGVVSQFSIEQTALACGFAAVFGHCYPVFHGFRGGKGAATAVGALMVIEPGLLIPMLATWLIMLVLSGYVGLATVLAGFSLVPATLYLGYAGELLVFCIVISLFMAFTHRSNLQNLRAGTEYRFERIRMVNWFNR